MLIILGVHGGQYFGFMFMEIFIAFVIQFGMKQDIKLHLRQNFLNEFFYYFMLYVKYFEPTRWRFTTFLFIMEIFTLFLFYSTKNPYDHEIFL